MINLSLIFLVIALVGPLVHIIVKKVTDCKQRLSIFINYILFFGIGLQGIYAFFGHYFRPVQTAESIGWTPAPQFQRELAFANLAVGVIAIVAVLRPQLRLAAIIVASVFLLGCAYGHILEIKKGNTAPNNTGVVLGMDIGLPVLLIALYASL